MIVLTGGSVTAAHLPVSLQGAAKAGAATPPARPAASGPVSNAQQNARQALATLRQAASGGGAKLASQSAARQKLEALKTRLKNLMMFGGDPAARAKEAAQIAKDIGEAAEEYARSGGGSPGPATTPSSATQPQEPGPPAQADAGAGVTAADPAPAAADPPAGMAGAPAPRKDGPQAAVSPPATAAGTQAAGRTTPGTAPRAGPGGQAAASAQKSADQAFIDDARLLARRADAILRSAIQEARRKKEATGDAGAAGDKALAAIDTAAFALGLGSGADPDAGTGYGAGAQVIAAAPAPTVTTTA